MTNSELFEIIKWNIYSCRSGIIAIERIERGLDSFPTSNFIIKSFDICRELTKDINQN